MVIKGAVWFTQFGGQSFGIVFGEDAVTKQRKAYIGNCTPRTQRKEDEQNIAEVGSKVDAAALKEVLNFLESKES